LDIPESHEIQPAVAGFSGAERPRFLGLYVVGAA
jgi:hypothetical protein